MAEIKLLFKLSGPDQNTDQLIVTEQGLRIGRTKDNNLFLDNRELSRQHARITWRADEERYYVEDLNSSNGSWFNDARLNPREPRELRPGDVLRFGPYVLTLTRFIMPVVEAVVPEEMIRPIAQSLATDHERLHSDPYLPGLSRTRSSWLQYLPGIFSEDDFAGRYLLIFESMFSPIFWTLDHFDLYLTPELAPEEWLHWMASWFDLLMIAELPLDRKRAIVRQCGWLFLRRGTRVGLERMLDLYFGVTPQIIEPTDEYCHFVVRLPLSQSKVSLGTVDKRDVAERLITSQKPAFTSYTLEIT